jgi:hypothetical protein
VLRTVIVPDRPIVPGTAPFVNENVLWIVKVTVARFLDRVNYAFFKINENGSGNVAAIVCGIEKNVFSILD